MLKRFTDKYFTISFTKQEVDLIVGHLPAESPINKTIQDKWYIHWDILSLPNKVLAAKYSVETDYIRKKQEEDSMYIF